MLKKRRKYSRIVRDYITEWIWLSVNFAAPCLFGIEGLLSDELKRLGAENVMAQNGRVLFSGDLSMLARANICSRFAERILIVLGHFKARSFAELFDNVMNIPLEDYIGKRYAFPVKGHCLNSKLHSVPDCQKIIKKAAVKRLSKAYHIDWFEETGTRMQLQFSIMKDDCMIMLDTSGEGLHKRGYRAASNISPIKETLAAAMASIARIYPDTKLYDPFCGSGTIAIEAALIANNMAPGLKRSFRAERFGFVDEKVFANERARAISEINRTDDFTAFCTDIDPETLEIAKHNAALAGVERQMRFDVADVRDFAPKTERGLVITNPPYGERMLDIKAARELYRVMGGVFEQKQGYKYYIITSDDEFEQIFGRTADKRRKLYNGSLKCQLYMYFRSNLHKNV